MQEEPQSNYTIEPMQLEHVDAATEMRLQSWLDTYPNEAHGVTRQWVEARNAEQVTEERNRIRKEKFSTGMMTGTVAGWVAKTADGTIIGATTPYIDEEGVQHVGSLYVDKNWHGKGVAGKLMQKVIDFFDPQKPIELGVVTYNERAKVFYRKWGFVEVPGSEALFYNKLPEVKMIRGAV